MKKIKIATFNANNLFIRYKFGDAYPGSRKIGVLDSKKGFLPIYEKGSYEIFNNQQRQLAAMALTDNGQSYPDIICLQEIESLIALRVFNDTFLASHYKNVMLVDSYDFRQIDVGILTNLDIVNIKSNVDVIDPEWDGVDELAYQSKHLFSRDCLEVELDTGATKLTVFINHLKSKFEGVPPAGVNKQRWIEEQDMKNDAKRLRQSSKVIDIVRKRFPGKHFNTRDFIVLGDLNEFPDAAAIKPLWDHSNLENVIKRIPNAEDRWTHYWNSKGRVSQLDHIFISPSISQRTTGVLPYIERRAVGFSGKSSKGYFLPKKVKFENQNNDTAPIEIDFQFPRFPEVSNTLNASDHCPVFFEFPV